MIIKKIRKNKAFTLIELMITVAIVGILAAVAVPLYQDYVIKSQVSEGFSLSDGIRTSEAEYYYNTGSFPSSLSTLGLNSPTGKYISGITLGDNGVISVKYGNSAMGKIQGGILTITPTPDTATSSIIHFECTGDGTILTASYLPAVCGTTTASGSTSSGTSGSGTSTSTGSSSSGSGSDSSSSDSSGSSSSSNSDTLTAQQASEYPEVAAAYNRYNDSKAEVATYQAQAAQYQAQAAAAQARGDMNAYNQLEGFAQNATAQANNYTTQMQQAETQYQQAITIYTQRNNGTLPSDFPGAPS